MCCGAGDSKKTPCLKNPIKSPKKLVIGGLVASPSPSHDEHHLRRHCHQVRKRPTAPPGSGHPTIICQFTPCAAVVASLASNYRTFIHNLSLPPSFKFKWNCFNQMIVSWCFFPSTFVSFISCDHSGIIRQQSIFFVRFGLFQWNAKSMQPILVRIS